MPLRFNSPLLALFLMPVLSAGSLAAAPARPAVTGISHMCVFAQNMPASADFYGRVLGATQRPDPFSDSGARFYFSPTQFVEVLPLPTDSGPSRMACVAWSTADAAGLHAYLESRHVARLSATRTAADGEVSFNTYDPEGNLVEFVQPARSKAAAPSGRAISQHIIHVGYAVKDRALEDRFYRDILGFRPYWFGAMQPGHLDWISAQVPDGHDWLEYMMIGDGSDVDLKDVNARELGVLNHFSLGVPNMEAAMTTMIGEDRLSPRHDGPQMGRDGKWQANFYDPDGTRVELMEFQPVTKPCCSAFTAASPSR